MAGPSLTRVVQMVTWAECAEPDGGHIEATGKYESLRVHFNTLQLLFFPLLFSSLLNQTSIAGVLCLSHHSLCFGSK